MDLKQKILQVSKGRYENALPAITLLRRGIHLKAPVGYGHHNTKEKKVSLELLRVNTVNVIQIPTEWLSNIPEALVPFDLARYLTFSSPPSVWLHIVAPQQNTSC